MRKTVKKDVHRELAIDRAISGVIDKLRKDDSGDAIRYALAGGTGEGDIVKIPRVSDTIDSVNHPPHYASGNIEVIEAIHDWKLGFPLGNAVKYIARAGKKNPDKYVEDLEKAIWYIRWELNTKKSKAEMKRPNDMPQERVNGK